MEPITWRSFAGLATLLALFLFTTHAQAAFTLTYCSSQNTAGDFQAMYDTWQSNGWCHDHCDGYAFGVVFQNNCWCSNYIPEDQQDTDECSDGCPGYPDEKCGNKNKNLYGYVKLAAEPSGTQGTAKPTSQVSIRPSTSKEAAPPKDTNPPPAPPSPRTTTVEITRDPETVLHTVTEPPETVTFTPSDTPSSPPTTLRTTSTPTTDPAAPPPPEQTSVRIITESGRVVTQTVITTPTSQPSSTEPRKSNTAAIVGGVVGGLAVLSMSIAGIFFILWRRRKQQREEDMDGAPGVQRNVSTMSKAGLLRSGPEMGPQYPPPIATNFTRRSSRGLDNESISPISGSDRRNSRPLVIDQRLNPSSLMVFDNSSRASVASIDDSRDYHRPLNVRNPDPDPE